MLNAIINNAPRIVPPWRVIYEYSIRIKKPSLYSLGDIRFEYAIPVDKDY